VRWGDSDNGRLGTTSTYCITAQTGFSNEHGVFQYVAIEPMLNASNKPMGVRLAFVAYDRDGKAGLYDSETTSISSRGTAPPCQGRKVLRVEGIR